MRLRKKVCLIHSYMSKIRCTYGFILLSYDFRSMGRSLNYIECLLILPQYLSYYPFIDNKNVRRNSVQFVAKPMEIWFYFSRREINDTTV